MDLLYCSVPSNALSYLSIQAIHVLRLLSVGAIVMVA